MRLACWFCGARANRQEGKHGPGVPAHGTRMVCMHCGQPGVCVDMAGQLAIRACTPAELADLWQNDDYRRIVILRMEGARTGKRFSQILNEWRRGQSGAPNSGTHEQSGPVGDTG